MISDIVPSQFQERLPQTPALFSYLIYVLIPLALTGLSIFISRFLGSDSFEGGSVESIEHANNAFLPSYLGYFFVALSVGNTDALVFVYVTLFIFTFLSQALYFNPLFLIFGYEFYNVRTTNGTCIFLISAESFKEPKDVAVATAYRINDYTFIQKRGA